LKAVVAFSGGLDTSTIVVLLRKKHEAEVITVTVDVGQEEDLLGVEEWAYKLGANKHYLIDSKEEFAEEYIFRAIKANALYEGKYPLGSALARPLIAKKVAEVAIKEGADVVAHGCTSKGNDQVRFDLTLRAYLKPDIKVIAPIRELGLSRAKSLEILKHYGFEPRGAHKNYSIDENLWSRSIEGGELDNPLIEPTEEAFSWTTSPESAPDKPLYLEVEFKEGVPVAVNGDRLSPASLVMKLNKLIGLQGYGRIDFIESRVVGLKSREVYEAPAALALIESHKDLERMVLTPRELRLKNYLDELWADLVYQGLWIDPLREHIEVAINSMNKHVTGVVKLKVYKGGLRVVGRDSPYSLYSQHVIDYDKGWYPSDCEARGFITIHGLYALTAQSVRSRRGS